MSRAVTSNDIIEAMANELFTRLSGFDNPQHAGQVLAIVQAKLALESGLQNREAVLTMMRTMTEKVVVFWGHNMALEQGRSSPSITSH